MNSKLMLMIPGPDRRNINCESGSKIEKRDAAVD